MNLKTALKIAKDAHRRQLDKGGESYIFHPIRVALQLETEEEKIVALLHDVVEDSEYSIMILKEYMFSDSVIEALTLLTKNKGMEYQTYIENIKKNALATKVKIADLTDNLDTTRLPAITIQDSKRIKKYHRAYDFLTN